MDAEIGVKNGAINISGKVNFEWRISKFFSLLEDKDSYYFGPNFVHSDSEWHLEIKPNAYSKGGTDGWISLVLVRQDEGPPKTLKFKLGIKKADGTVKFRSKEKIRTFTTDGRICKWKFLKRSELLKRQSVLVPSGTLTVICTMWSPEEHSVEDCLLERLQNLSSTLKNMLIKGENTDVVLKLKSGEIRAHRSILKSRSSVFKNMLDSDTSVSRTGVIELPDDDEDAFDVVLIYIYCGELENLDPKNVCEVYKIAHKYHLPELKKACCLYIKNNMTIDLACDVIPIFHLCEETGLDEYAKNFVANNMNQIAENEKWKELKKKNSSAVSELLEINLENPRKKFKRS